MDIFRASENLMSMDDTTWQRHANPLSVFSRFSCLPLIVLAIWSRAWLDWWFLIPLALAILWTWVNPRLFSIPDMCNPSEFQRWAMDGVLGERLFLRRNELELPTHHVSMSFGLTGMSAMGVVLLIYGLVVQDVGFAVGGTLIAMISKTWFVDRMVWLKRDHTID